ncbi:MAG: GNAT family N-acetyltransferase [Acidimicrobiia bacterium]|nr:GNAT family N-acetyltransferase [Acidimicrobiia bacterium]
MNVLGRWAKPILVGQLVTLRPLDASDTDAMWEMVNDPLGNDLTATTSRFTYDQIEAWCSSRIDQDERLDLAIVENSTGLFAGEVVLNEFDVRTNSVNFRISLRAPAWFGRGLGTEAIQLIVDHALRTLEVSALKLEVLERNERARWVYEKVGFRESGEFVDDDESWIRMELNR